MTEQNELLEAALKLAETFKSIENKADWSMETQQALDTIEKHRPKPELVECWVNLYKDGSRNYYKTERIASGIDNFESLMIRRAVHLREVTPAPEWERWRTKSNFQIWQGETMIHDCASGVDANEVVNLHNAEMQRVTGTKGK